MGQNKNLIKSKISIDDEWYTQYKDIEKYLLNFKRELEGKVIYCPCDSNESNFVKYLKENKELFNYKELLNSSKDFMLTNFDKWEKAEVIITNPPFSLKTQFYKQVKEYNCKLIVLLPDTLITNKVFTNDLINKKLFMDYTNKTFIRPDGTLKKAGASWYNDFKKVWTKNWKYKAGAYVMSKDWIRYYNRCDNIDPTYDKEMYVPITFIKGTNIEKYTIIGTKDNVEYNNKKAFKTLKIKLKRRFLWED